MGLSQSDVTQIKTEHDTTMQAVYDGVVCREQCNAWVC